MVLSCSVFLTPFSVNKAPDKLSVLKVILGFCIILEENVRVVSLHKNRHGVPILMRGNRICLREVLKT